MDNVVNKRLAVETCGAGAGAGYEIFQVCPQRQEGSQRESLGGTIGVSHWFATVGSLAYHLICPSLKGFRLYHGLVMDTKILKY
jgi:hypothetical protein